MSSINPVSDKFFQVNPPVSAPGSQAGIDLNEIFPLILQLSTPDQVRNLFLAFYFKS